MTETPLVTVITPSFQQAEYIEDTIRSVLLQDYSNLEYLVVDGGSSDGTVEIIQSYDEKITWWVSEQDQGQAEAINKGFARARGEIVAWLNSDDIYLPGAISSAVEVFNRYPDVGLVYGDAITIDKDGKPLNNLSFSEYSLDDLMRFQVICQPAVFIKRKVLETAGYLDLQYHFMLDHELWLRVAQESPIKHLGRIVAAARHHPSAKNVAQSERFAHEILSIMERMRIKGDLSARYSMNERKNIGGGSRLVARYLLDGGKTWESLRYYAKAFIYWPWYALKHWHRILFALLSLIGGQKLGQLYSERKSRILPDLPPGEELHNWPGISI